MSLTRILLLIFLMLILFFCILTTEVKALGQTTYVVQPGDTLTSIALKFHLQITDLIVANKIKNPDLLYPGDVLTIPEPKPVTFPDKRFQKLSSLRQKYSDKVDDKLIYVDLSDQKVYVFSGDQIINSFIISSGVANYPTVTGNFQIERKYLYEHMIGPGYDLPDVPYTMYFHLGYAFHGTYWHNNFGFPMSHGCLNMRTEDAEWLYYWTPIGTAVQITP